MGDERTHKANGRGYGRAPGTLQRPSEPEPLSGLDVVLGLQSTAGNAAVSAYLRGGVGSPGAAPGAGGIAVQRDEDDDEDGGGTPDESGSGETDSGETNETSGATDETSGGGDAGGGDSGSGAGTETEADTDTNAAFDQAESDLEDQLRPENVIDQLSVVALNDRAGGDSSGESPVAQALAMQRDTPPGPEPAPKAGGISDVIDALMPFLQPVLDRLKEAVLRDLRRLKAGEAVATIVVALPIIIGPLTQPGPRRLALDQLNGTDITFGVVPNLKISPTITDGQLRGGTVTYDLAPFLRSRGIPF